MNEVQVLCFLMITLSKANTQNEIYENFWKKTRSLKGMKKGGSKQVLIGYEYLATDTSYEIPHDFYFDYPTEQTFKSEESHSQERKKMKAEESGSIENIEEFSRRCPTSCPAQVHMVCVKCNNSVYKTFMSICHVRVYQCNHRNEALELVSYRPCMHLGPELAGLPPPSEWLHAPDDEDTVLWYTYCRHRRLIGKHPNCKFK